MSNVNGCSAPRTRSTTGSSAANWSRAAAGAPAFPVQRARLVAGGQGVPVLGAQDALHHGQQHGVLVAGRSQGSRLPGPAGQAAAAARVSRCSAPRTRSITGSSTAYWSRAAARAPASPAQRARPARRGQGVPVLGAQDALHHGQQHGVLVAGYGRGSRLPGRPSLLF